MKDNYTYYEYLCKLALRRANENITREQYIALAEAYQKARLHAVPNL